MKFEIPTLIYQEKGCVMNHSKEMAAYGKKAFIITGRGSSKKNGSLMQVQAALEKEGTAYVVFDEIEENPSVETCVRAAELGIKEGVDYCIGIGGGSPLDATKAIALLIGNQTLDDSIFYQKTDMADNALPVVEVPTTAGTGSEVTPYAILTLHGEHTKKSISYRIFPKLALCDPEYLSFAPMSVIVSTTMDVLAHLIESYLNTNATLYSRMLVEAGLKLWGEIKDELCDKAEQTADAHALSEETYRKMMMASSVAGMAITHTGTSLPHGLSYPVTYEEHIAHGAACGLFLPGYLAFCDTKWKEGAVCKNENLISSDVTTILSLLHMQSLEEFKEVVSKLLSNYKVENCLFEKDVELTMANPAKLNNCPFEIQREEMLLFLA